MPKRLRLPPTEPTVLFTGFEPSGDDHASAVVRVLKRRRPELKIFAWGGPKMAAAGAEVIEQTGADAVMGMPGLAKIREHQQINKRIGVFLDKRPVTLHVPVDSPAANFPICKIARARGARVMHLVAPQVWAWGSWRVRKLRRLTDHVCCLLPFEEAYFRERGISASFVGHPLFDEAPDLAALDQRVAELGLPEQGRKLAIMPGSRPVELSKNFPSQLKAFQTLKKEHPTLVGAVAAADESRAVSLRRMAHGLGGWPDDLHLVIAETDAVIRWADLGLIVSGTVTLQVARQQKPMVVMYRSSPIFYYLFAKWVLATEHLTLPNLVADRRIVPELMPYFGNHGVVVHELMGLMERAELRRAQVAALTEVTGKFAGHNAAESAATQIERMLGLVPSH